MHRLGKDTESFVTLVVGANLWLGVLGPANEPVRRLACSAATSLLQWACPGPQARGHDMPDLEALQCWTVGGLQNKGQRCCWVYGARHKLPAEERRRSKRDLMLQLPNLSSAGSCHVIRSWAQCWALPEAVPTTLANAQ